MKLVPQHGYGHIASCPSSFQHGTGAFATAASAVAAAGGLVTAQPSKKAYLLYISDLFGNKAISADRHPQTTPGNAASRGALSISDQQVEQTTPRNANAPSFRLLDELSQTQCLQFG